MRSVPIDQGLIDRAIDGDKEAFAILVRATGSRSLIVAERILRSPDDAVSAARKLFVLAYRNLKKLKDLGVLELWLMQNLVRLCGESLKDAAKKGVALPVECDSPRNLAEAGLLDTVGAADDAAGLPGTVGAVDSTSSASRAEARRGAVKKAVDCLPFLERTAVIFRDWDGISYLEVAEILRVKQDDLRKLLVRGRKHVADMLTPSGQADREVDKKAAQRRRECEKTHDRIWLFVGGEIGPVEQAGIITHLGQCPACKDVLRRASTVLEAIRDAAPLEDKPLIAPEMLWKEVEPLLAK